jgi:hypothetical protein
MLLLRNYAANVAFLLAEGSCVVVVVEPHLKTVGLNVFALNAFLRLAQNYSSKKVLLHIRTNIVKIRFHTPLFVAIEKCSAVPWAKAPNPSYGTACSSKHTYIRRGKYRGI